MAERKGNTVSPVGQAVPKKYPETVYPANELVKAAARFRTKEECVAAALRYAGKKEATIRETEDLVKKFLQKEVQ